MTVFPNAVLKGSGELTTGDTVRLGIDDAHDLGMRALQGFGYDREEAKIIVDQLVDNALCGYTFAGLNRISAIAADPRSRQPRHAVTVVRETPSSAMLDGGNNVGYIAVWHAAETAIRKAKSTGFALVGLNNSYFSGRLAYYMEHIVRADLCAIHSGSGSPKIAPFGGTGAVFGTNPIAFGFPSDNGPVILDMGTAAIQRGDLEMKARIGEELPEGIALDASGHPTRDANAALKGSVRSFGGHKGSGLSLMVQITGLLGGAALMRGDSGDQGYLFIVFDPGLLMSPADFKQQVAQLIEEVKATPREPGVEEIMIPSERSFRERQRRRKGGHIVIDRKLYNELNEMARSKL